MVASSQQTGTQILLACISVIFLIFCLAGILWGRRLYKLRGYHLRDFRRFVTEARRLSTETSRIRREVEGAEFVDASAKLNYIDVLTAAAEWDIGLKIALAAWEDIMQPAQPDVGNEKGGMLELDRSSRTHRKYFIGLMRGKCQEGLQQRRKLSSQLEEIHTELTSGYDRYCIDFSIPFPPHSLPISPSRSLLLE